jgi:hypothetical protein
MQRPTIAIWPVLLVAVACHRREDPLRTMGVAPSTSPSTTLPAPVLETSIGALLANPSGFQERKIAILGFVRVETENDAIYPSEAAERAGHVEEALWLSFSRDRLQYGEFTGRFCRVIGYFDPKIRGHMGVHRGGVRVLSMADSPEPSH